MSSHLPNPSNPKKAKSFGRPGLRLSSAVLFPARRMELQQMQAANQTTTHQQPVDFSPIEPSTTTTTTTTAATETLRSTHTTTAPRRQQCSCSAPPSPSLAARPLPLPSVVPWPPPPCAVSFFFWKPELPNWLKLVPPSGREGPGGKLQNMSHIKIKKKLRIYHKPKITN